MVIKRKEIISVATLIFFFAFSLYQKEKPKIVFTERVHDFGSVKEGEVLSYVFIFKNEGNAALKITKVKTSCGCTAALLSTQEVQPGEKGELKVNFATRGYEGRVSKYIFVESNDPSQPQAQLEVTALIQVPPRPRIELDRFSLDVGLVVEPEDILGEVKVKNAGDLELSVEFTHDEASFFSEGKRVAFPLKIAAGKTSRIEIRVPSQEKKGVIREYILIKSNDPLRSTFSLHLSGYVVTKNQLKELFLKYKDILK